MLRSLAIGIFGGSSEDSEEASLSQDSSDEDGDEGGGVGGGTPISWLLRSGYSRGYFVFSNDGIA